MHVVRVTENAYKEAYRAKAAGADPSAGSRRGMDEPASRSSVGGAAAFSGEVPQSKRSSARSQVHVGSQRSQIVSQRSKVSNPVGSHASQRQDGPPDTRAFARDYASFWQLDNVNPQVIDQARKLKKTIAAQDAAAAQAAPLSSGRLNTGLRSDPQFQANMARFYDGENKNDNQEFYKDYRQFYGAETPQLKNSTHMAANFQDQQKRIVKNRLAENAKKILNLKETTVESQNSYKVQSQRSQKGDSTASQMKHLALSGHQKAAAQVDLPQKTPSNRSQVSSNDAQFHKEPESYKIHSATGALDFAYKKDFSVQQVTKNDPKLKLTEGMRYNIVTGSLQLWH